MSLSTFSCLFTSLVLPIHLDSVHNFGSHPRLGPSYPPYRLRPAMLSRLGLGLRAGAAAGTRVRPPPPSLRSFRFRSLATAPPPPPPPSTHPSPSAPLPEHPRPAEEDLLALGLRPDSLGPTDVPPLRERLRPLIPFLVIWTIITSLAMHLLRVRKRSEADTARSDAQESVLLGLIERFRAGEVVPDLEIRRELEMVGLRERTVATEGMTVEEMREVSWWEVLRGRREQRAKREERMGGGEDEAVEEWSRSEYHLCEEEELRRRRGEGRGAYRVEVSRTQLTDSRAGGDGPRGTSPRSARRDQEGARGCRAARKVGPGVLVACPQALRRGSAVGHEKESLA